MATNNSFLSYNPSSTNQNQNQGQGVGTNQPSQWSQQTGYGPNANPSGSDPKGIGQNQSQYQQSRYENQQGPLANQASYNYGQGSTQNMGDYNNIMSGYGSFLGGSGFPQQNRQSYGQPQQSNQPQQVATAPDGVPIYSQNGNYYTQNSDGSMIQQFQGGTPSWLQQSSGGGQSSGGQSSGGPPQIQGTTFDPNTIGQFLQWQAQQPGADPILQTPGGIQYYTQQILSKPDGLSNSNMQYWANKATLAQFGGAVGAPEGGGSGGFGSLQSFQQMNPQAMAAMNSAIGGYQGFANTGGYSDQDIANLRARGTAPVRTAYANAQDAIDRQRSLQGGYSPNATATEAQMARNQGQAMSDAMQNVNAGIVNQRNQNQLAGLAGLSGTGSGMGNLGYNYSQLGQQGVLGALQGQTSLYGATPGMASTFGNQAIGVVGQGGQFGNSLYANDINNQRNPGQLQNTLNGINGVGNTISNIGGALSPLLNNNTTNIPTNGNNAPYDPGAFSGPTTPNAFTIDPTTGYPYEGY